MNADEGKDTRHEGATLAFFPFYSPYIFSEDPDMDLTGFSWTRPPNTAHVLLPQNAGDSYAGDTARGVFR